MVGIVLATHGKFAEGIKMSGEMVFGKQEDVEAVTLMPEMGPDDFKAGLEKAVAKLSDPNEVLILADLWGGTPFNQSSGLLAEHETWAIVTGLNLPMLIEALASRGGATTAHELAEKMYIEGKKGVRILPDSLKPAPYVTKAAAAGITGAMAPGTLVGDGKIKFVLCRVDTRLLHGQVATTWTKQTNPDRIIVVSDGVAHDDLRKSMIEQAAPPGVHVNVVPVDKMIEVAKDTRFGATKAMLLFETPQDLLRAVEGGVDIKKVNLGSMAHSVGKVVVSNAIAMGDDDVKTLEKLQAKGIEFDVRKVPADSPESFEAMLKKAKTELAAEAK